jgi:hypothetical protein
VAVPHLNTAQFSKFLSLRNTEKCETAMHPI